MKILHIVEDFSIKSGGLRTVIKNLDFYLNKEGFYSCILSSDKEMEDNIHIVKTTNKWLYSKEWTQKIDEIVTEQKIDLIHIHGVWLYPQYIGAKYAIKNNIKMVLSAHGMYQPWMWKKGIIYKKIYFYFLSNKWFSKASVIHTITANETKNIKYYFKKNKIVEIPNLIGLVKQNALFIEQPKYILYLGRLNKTKGIDILINSFAEIENKHLSLKIAGGFNDYKKDLDTLIASLNLTDKVEFVGEVKNKEKDKLIKNAWVMVSASYSDVIGMVNLEAASLNTPMITTYNTGLKKEWNVNGGKLINPDKEELIMALTEVLNWTEEERYNKGKELFNFVEQNYSWKTKIVDWLSLYKSLK
jgi:glycosyltransferase involved in cell wall biosynthesis